MAQSVVEIIINAKNNASKSLKGISVDMKELGAKSAIMGAAITGAIGLVAKAAAEGQQASVTFGALAKSIGEVPNEAIESLRRSTRGLVDDTNLMKAGNKFMAMGLATNSDEMNKLAEVATRLGSAMGSGATESMENFALMMANQSIPRLDSFGISSGQVRARIEELMAANVNLTREQAFNTAVMEQAEVTMGKLGVPIDTAADKMARMTANIENLKGTLGDVLLPMLEPVVAKIGEVVAAVSGWIKENPKLAETIGTVLAIFGPLLLILPMLVSMILAIASPIGLIIIGFGLLVAAGVLLYKNWELIKAKIAEVIASVKQSFGDFVQSVKDKFKEMVDYVKGIFTSIVEAIGGFIQAVKDKFMEMANFVKGVFNTIVGAVGVFVQAVKNGFMLLIGPVITVFTFIFALIVGMWVEFVVPFMEKVMSFINWLGDIFNMVKEPIVNAFSSLWAAISGIWSEFVVAFLEKVTPFINWLGDIFNTLKETLIATFNSLWTAISNIWSEFVTAFLEKVTAFIGWFVGVFNALKETLIATFKSIWSVISGIWSEFVAAFMEKVNVFTGWLGDIFNALKEPIMNAFSSLWGGVSDVTTSVWDGITGKIKGYANNIINIVNGIISAINSVASAGAAVTGVNISSIPTIPQLATGGIVTRPTLALIGEAGPEAVIPLSGGAKYGVGANNGQGSNQNISIMQGATINVSGQADEQRFAKTISQELARVMQTQNHGLSSAL